MRYDYILIDTLNLAHKIFTQEKEAPSYVSKKQVFKRAVGRFIEEVELLEKEYLHSTGEIFLLIDNPSSRIDLQSSFYFADRKEAYKKYKKDRAKQPKEFYNSINLLKYYFLVCDERYHTVQIPKLEADDLVEPILRLKCKNKKSLLVTSDLDWVRYLNSDVDWMPHLNSVETVEDLSLRLGFKVSDCNVTAYKSLFGDPSDNIPNILTAKYKEKATPLIESLDTADDLLFIINSDSYVQKYPFLLKVREKYNQLRINLQLVKAIPLSDSHVLSVITTGRDSSPMRKAVRQAIDLDKEDSGKFVFGGIKRPRI